jgi:outer membrane protein OmpU
MNKLKKIGLTALAASLATATAHSAELSVTGSASMFYSSKEKGTSTGWYMTDKINMTGSGSVNGLDVTYGMNIDDSDSTSSTVFDEKYIKVGGSFGTIQFNGNAGDSVISAWDDKLPTAYEESHNGADSSDDYSGDNSFFYESGNIIDGVNILASYLPGGGGRGDAGSADVGVQFTGIDGLTIGLASGSDKTSASAEVDYSAAYATYAIGSFTVGAQMNDSDDATANSDEEFTAFAVSYAASDDLTISYGYSEIDYELSSKPNQEAAAISASYTMGSLGIAGSYHDIENASGGTTDQDNYNEFEIALSFAF